MALDDFLSSQTCDICLKAPSQDRTGAPSRDPYTVVASGVPVLINPQGGSVEQRNDRRTQVSPSTIFIDPIDLPSGFELTAKHQIRVPNRSGRVFVIQSVNDPNEMGNHLEIAAEEQPA